MSSRTGQMILRGRSIAPVVPQVEHVDPPEHLSPVAQEIFQDLVAELGPIGQLSTLDITPLCQLCEAYADWAEARSALALVEDRYETDDRGRRHAHPAIAVAAEADRRLRGWMSEFQLSPTSRLRARIDMPQGLVPSGEDPIDLSTLNPDEREALRSLIEGRRQREEESADA